MISNYTRTVGLHRFEGAATARPEEQARATKTAPAAMEVIAAKGPEGTRGRPLAKPDFYSVRI